MKLSELKVNPENPRLIKDDKFEKLCRSIKDFPEMMELRPIVIDEENMILGGNMRFKALKELKYKDIPDNWVKRADELTEAKKREFVAKDNVGFGEWDWEVLSGWDENIEEWGLDIPDFEDYSDKNKEIDTNDFDDEMVIKLKYTEDDYLKVREQLSEIASTPEQAVWKLLGNES